jgi:hypothetical protein
MGMKKASLDKNAYALARTLWYDVFNEDKDDERN